MKFISFTVSNYQTLTGSLELWYYLCKKSVCQMVIEISGVKLACAFLHKKYSTLGPLGIFDGEGY